MVILGKSKKEVMNMMMTLEKIGTRLIPVKEKCKLLSNWRVLSLNKKIFK